MASTFIWAEDNGAAINTPPRGTSRTHSVSNIDWKNIDDVNSSYAAYPITAPGNSFTKYHFGIFSGSFNQISEVKFAHVSGLLDSNINIKFLISGSGAYVAPGTGTNIALTGTLNDIFDISTGRSVNVGLSGPEFVTTGTTLTATGYTAYISHQMQVGANMGPGNLLSGITYSLRFLEN